MSDKTRSNDAPEPEGGQSQPEGTSADAAGFLSGAEELMRVLGERDNYLEQLQRTRAEFANYQKRSKAQADADRAYAVGNLAHDLVNVIDNFERALQSARSSGASSIVEGLELVHRQFLEALAKHGVEPIVALGQPFDPHQHEAIAQQPSADHPEGTVVAELSRGYKIRDRILRPSRVAVSKAP